MDLASLDKWDVYTAAKEAMFRHTHTADAPWTVVRSNDKKRGRLEAMRFILHLMDYPDKDVAVIGEPDPLIVGPPTVVAADAGESAHHHGADGPVPRRSPDRRAGTHRDRELVSRWCRR